MATARKSAATVQTPGKAPKTSRTSAPAPTGADGEEDPGAGPAQPSGVEAEAAAKFTTDDVDPSTLAQPVMTRDGWLCPEPKPGKA